VKPISETEKLEKRVSQLEQTVKELKGGKQPNEKIKVWGSSGPPSPGSKEIGTLITKIKGRQKGKGMDTNQVQEELGLVRSRTVEVMRQLGNHPHLKYVSGSGSKASKIMVPSKKI